MRRAKIVGSTVAASLTLGALLASGAPASAALVLKAGGQPAPVGTPVLGMLEFGPCGTFESTGKLTVNGSSVDAARFGVTSGRGGGCGEGGPIVTGSVSADKLSETGRFTVVANLTYTETSPLTCSYAVKRLRGTFTVPGGAQASLSGTGRLKPGNGAGCPERVHVTGAAAQLYDADTKELLEAEP
jgi:hypothetical protein